MSRLDDYIQGVTERLRPDPELHMDVAHEVRTHLEEAAADARTRGLGEEDSIEAALKAFGDVSVIAQQMWQANRGRMRARALTKWAARSALLPAALLVTALLATADWGLLAWLRVFPFGSGRQPQLSPPGPRQALTEDERFAFERITDRVQDAEALVERYPHDPVYYAYYVQLWFVRLPPARLMHADQLEDALAVLNRGRTMEPDNAFYDYLRASLLMDRSAGYVKVEQGGQADEWQYAIQDRPAFERAVRVFLEGVRKPHLDSHLRATIGRKVAWAKPPTSLREEVALLSELGSYSRPEFARADVRARSIRQGLWHYVLSMAAEDDGERASEVMAAMERLATQTAEDAQLPNDFPTASLLMHDSSRLAVEVYEKLGMPGEAAAARKRYEAENVFLGRAPGRTYEYEGAVQAYEYKGEVPERRPGTLLLLTPDQADVPATPSSWALRAAEHIVMQRAAVATLVMSALLLVALFAALACWGALRLRGRADQPKLFFVGWRRLGWIALVCVILPGAAYWAYTRAATWSSMQHTVWYALGRRSLEFDVLYAWVLVSLMAMCYSAIRARCMDAGMKVSPRGFFHPLGRPLYTAGALFAGLSSAAFGLLTSWYVHGAVLLFALLWWNALSLLAFVFSFARFHWEALRRADPLNAHFRMTFARSVIPILAASVILLGGASWALLGAAEKAKIRIANTPGESVLLAEPAMAWERGRWERLHKLHEAAGGGRPGTAPGEPAP
jgi:hypothetical protein